MNVILSLAFITTCSVLMFSCDESNKSAQQEEIKHDWQYSYIIKDGYSEDGKYIYHYIDSYTRNVDRSISFIGEDGLITTLPYPYFEIIIPKAGQPLVETSSR